MFITYNDGKTGIFDAPILGNLYKVVNSLTMIKCDADGIPLKDENIVHNINPGDILIPCSFLGNESWVYFDPTNMILLTESRGWSPMLEVLDEETK